MAARDSRAIILAAGMGTRLRSVVDERPKGLIEIDGETLVGRSVGVLRDAGISDVIIVTGYCADQYDRFAAQRPGVRTIVNRRFDTSGSMASLARALDATGPGDRGDLLVLESDIVYETQAVAAILASPISDATLLSGPTGAGDEVWVCAPNGRVQRMSKRATELPSIAGEFVGISRLSAEGALAMRQAFAGFVTLFGHERMDYETGGLVAVAARHAIAAVLVPDLLWGEIDDERQFARVTGDIWPKLQAMRAAE